MVTSPGKTARAVPAMSLTDICPVIWLNTRLAGFSQANSILPS
jgi:hypothetical protein